MSAFHMGQRVRIKWSNTWPELSGKEGKIVGKARGTFVCGSPCDWWVAPDFWGSHIAPKEGLLGGCIFAPNEEQLEPLTDSNDLVSWESMRDLWVPEHLRVKV